MRVLLQVRESSVHAQTFSKSLGKQELQKQQQQDQEDQAELQERHAEIKQKLEDDAELGAEDGVNRQIAWIWKIALAYSTDLRIVEVCTRWKGEMADLNRRMRRSWTEVEKTSLVLLLIRFTGVLKNLLQPLPSGSVYDPVARPATDHTRIVELFVSSGNSFPRVVQADLMTTVRATNCADQLERQGDQAQGGESMQ